MYKIIAVDIDGTLVDSQKNITPKTYDALINAMKLGKKLVIATGRPLLGVHRYIEELELAKYGGYVMPFNGGKIINAAHPETPVYNVPFPNEYIAEICKVLKGRNVTINSYEGDYIIGSNKITEYTDVEPKIVKMEFKFIEDFPSYVTFPINKCLLAGDPREILELEDIFKEMFKGRLNIFKSEPYFLEMVPLGIDKAKSLDKLLEMLSIKTEECIACGDGFNDVTMIEYAGLGVAMANATEPVKKAANLIAPSNDEDGIAYVVENYLMK